MSDTLESILAKPIGVSVLPQYQGWQDLAHAQAQTALTQQQVQGAAIGNQLASLGVGQKAYGLNLLGVPTPGYGTPGGQPNALAGVAPQGAAPAQPGSLGGVGGAPAAQGAAAPQSNGIEYQGINMPRAAMAGIVLSPNPAEAVSKINDLRRQAIFQTVSSADPQDYPAAMTKLAQDGWVSQAQLQDALAHPEGRSRILQATLTPEAYQSAQTAAQGQGIQYNPQTGQPMVSGTAVAADAATAAAKSGGEAAGALPYVGPKAAADAAAKAPYGEWQEMTVADGQGNLHVEYVSPQQRAAMSGGARPTTAADMANPAVSITPAAFAGRVGQTESGNNPAQGQSATSSASGSAQFLPSTFVPIARQIAPQQTQGMSDAQVAALRNDTSPAGQALVQQATQAYAQQNAGVLQSAGAPVTSATLGLAHRFGGQGAVSVLNAPANAPISSVVSPQVMAANPDLKGMTVGGVLGKSYGQYGVNPVSFGQDAAAPGGAAPIVPGAIPGKPVLTPQQQADLDVKKATETAANTSDISAMQTYRTDTAKAAQTAQQNNTVLDQMRQEGQSFDHGNFTDAYQGMAKLYGSVAQSLGGTMPASVGDWEAFNKNAGQLARTAASGLSSRVGVQELQLVQKYLPSDTMSSQAFSRVADQLQGINDYQVARNAAAANFSGNPSQFEANFNKNVTPGVFIVNRMSAPDATVLAQNLQKTPEGRRTWAGIMAGAAYAKQNGLLDAVGPGQGQ